MSSPATETIPPTRRADPRALVPGTVLGRFVLLGLLGRGGMGEVHLAEERPLGVGELPRRVALKVLRVGAALAPEAAQRFERERALLARVEHPAVVRTLGPLETDATSGLAYFPLELVLGKSLADLVTEQGPLGIDDALRVLARVAAALGAIHAQGIIHRDVKPSNVLIARTGAVRLADFGLARALDDARFTATGVALGTPLYMAPEQARGEASSPASDLYSLGALGYEILTGRPPFEAESSLALLRLHADEKPRPPRERRAELPPAVDALVLSLLEKDPKRRPESAVAVERALESLLAERAAARELDPRVTTVIERETRFLAVLADPLAVEPRAGRRSPLGAPALVVGLALAALAGAGFAKLAGGERAPVERVGPSSAPGSSLAHSPDAVAPAPTTAPSSVAGPSHAKATLRLRDGGTLVGEVVAVGESVLLVRTAQGDREVAREEIATIEYEER